MYKYCFAIILLLFTSSLAFAQNGYRVKTVSGDTAGYMNGIDAVALFNSPSAIVSDNAGNLYVADTYNNVIRKISVTDSVSTFAGNDSMGYVDGAGSVAEFNAPLGICIDHNDNLYVADTYNNVIRKITPSGIVSTLAGNGEHGFKNGQADSAEFYLPTGVAVDTSGNIYVADDGNYAVREISTSGNVTTIAGTGYSGFNNGAGDTAAFNGLFGIAVNDSGVIYVTEYLSNDIRRISNGMVSVFAGNDSIPETGFRDGANDTALFDGPTGIVTDKSGNIYVCDEYNNRIREISKGTVSTFAGNGTAGWLDTLDYQSEFNQPYGITLHNGIFYVADNANNNIREIEPIVLGITPLYPKEISMFVYPNPCTDKLIIASAPSGNAALVDVAGREVWSNDHFKAPCIISTVNLSPGMYFLRVSNTSGIGVKKIIVNH